MTQEQLNENLLDAAYDNDIDAVKKYLEQGADIEAMDADGRSSMYWAAGHYGNTEMVKLLLEKGAKVNARSKYGSTTMYWAVYEGHTEVVELLKQHGAKE